jgi:hypothetical protein
MNQVWPNEPASVSRNPAPSQRALSRRKAIIRALYPSASRLARVRLTSIMARDASVGRNSAMTRSVPPVQPLLVLVGITAGAADRAHVGAWLEALTGRPVLVPDLPQRWGLAACARRLPRWLAGRIDPETPLDVMAYISGGFILRAAAAAGTMPPLGRVLWLRGPVQEELPAALIRRYTRLIAWLRLGRMVLDLAARRGEAAPFPESRGAQGLIIEEGVSVLAARFGLVAAALPPEAWSPARLAPKAGSVLRTPHSHDDAYRTEDLLAAAAHFFATGVFPEESPP